MQLRDRAPLGALLSLPAPNPPSSSAFASSGASATQEQLAPRSEPAANEPIRVMLVDDHAILREGLRRLLASVPDIEVVGEACNGVEALGVAAQCSPDVVIMDLDMPDGDGATATREMAKLERPPRVLILTMHSAEERLVALLGGGASGFLTKDAAGQELVDAIRVVASGEVYVRPSVARLLAANARPRTQQSQLDEARAKLETLSGRERMVLRRVAEGYSGVEIGRMLGVTPKTVDTYKNRIGQKLGFTHRADYVRFALRLGLLGAEDSQQSSDAESRLHRQPGP